MLRLHLTGSHPRSTGPPSLMRLEQFGRGDTTAEQRERADEVRFIHLRAAAN